MTRTLTLAVLLALTTAAGGQEQHQHHVSYQSWVNQHDKGCCNDRDCSELSEADERTTGGVLAVRIEGVWCPILSHHYLKRGNVPDASVSHVCVEKRIQTPADAPPCRRLLCYQPKPGS